MLRHNSLTVEEETQLNEDQKRELRAFDNQCWRRDAKYRHEHVSVGTSEDLDEQVASIRSGIAQKKVAFGSQE